MGQDEDAAAAGPSMALPTAMCFGASALAAVGFGAGYGARVYRTSAAFKELLEKFPETPTPAAEAAARTSATRAFAYGTGLAGLMGVGAVVAARAYGIRSADDFGNEVRKWLPTVPELKASVAPALEPLQRGLTDHLQGVREMAGTTVRTSALGRTVSRRAQEGSGAGKPLEGWEKEIVRAIDEAEQKGK